MALHNQFFHHGENLKSCPLEVQIQKNCLTICLHCSPDLQTWQFKVCSNKNNIRKNDTINASWCAQKALKKIKCFIPLEFLRLCHTLNSSRPEVTLALMRMAIKIYHILNLLHYSYNRTEYRNGFLGPMEDAIFGAKKF